jgi:hypothetical protein
VWGRKGGKAEARHETNHREGRAHAQTARWVVDTRHPDHSQPNGVVRTRGSESEREGKRVRECEGRGKGIYVVDHDEKESDDQRYHKDPAPCHCIHFDVRRPVRVCVVRCFPH